AGAALLRSAATKMGMAVVAPHAPPLRQHHLLRYGLRARRTWPTGSRHHSSSSSAPSGSTPPPPINNKVRAEVASLLTLTKVASFVMFGIANFLYFLVKLRLEALIDEVNALRRERSILIKAVEECQRTHIQPQD
ncbi:hypothetical protein SETIT_1G041100v2, partial [Setaria italica]